MDILKSSFSPNQFTLRKGIPVKWVIEGKEMNECNKTIVIPQYKMKIELKEGKQIIEFTPSGKRRGPLELLDGDDTRNVHSGRRCGFYQKS